MNILNGLESFCAVEIAKPRKLNDYCVPLRKGNPQNSNKKSSHDAPLLVVNRS